VYDHIFFALDMLVRSTHISIGIDVGKARNATTVADAERGGEVRFIGEVDASPDAIRQVLQRIAAKYDVVHFCYEAGPTGHE